MPSKGRSQIKVNDADGVERIIDNDSDGSVHRQIVWATGPQGTWSYVAGTTGTEVISGFVMRIVVVASSLATGSVTIDGGDTISVPANRSIELRPNGELKDPTVVFTSTGSYVVEYVT